MPIGNSQNEIIGAICVTSIPERIPLSMAKKIVEAIKPEMESIKPPI
jgi:hypothetical protein